MLCPRCGQENPASSEFCSRCGTDLRAQAMGPGPAASAPGAAGTAALPAQTSGTAIASLICGLLFFFFPSALAAVILGHLSLGEIRRSAGRLAGQGMATAGLVLGYIGLAIIPLLLIIAAIVIPNLMRARWVNNEASAIAMLRTIVTANESYSSAYANGYATKLRQLDGAQAQAPDCNHAQLLTAQLASGFRSGYRFIYAPKQSSGAKARVSGDAAAKGCKVPGAAGFTVLAEPINRGSTGQRSFFVDETGVIRAEATGPATANSPALNAR
jgi:type IV pilus assembly protein PilA